MPRQAACRVVVLVCVVRGVPCAAGARRRHALRLQRQDRVHERPGWPRRKRHPGQALPPHDRQQRRRGSHRRSDRLDQHRHPTWSPDRTKIAYARGDPAMGAMTENFDVYILDLTTPGAVPQAITNTADIGSPRVVTGRHQDCVRERGRREHRPARHHRLHRGRRQHAEPDEHGLDGRGEARLDPGLPGDLLPHG